MLRHVPCVLLSPNHSAGEDLQTDRRHERQQWKFSRVETVAGGDVRAAAPGLRRFGVPDGSAQGADKGAGQAGVRDAGAVAEVQAAGRTPAR